VVVLSDEQRTNLQESLDDLNKELEQIPAIVAEYNFPNAYIELKQLMERQKVAIANLLEDKEVGCELRNLEFFKTMRDKPHLANQAYAGREALKIDPQEQNAFMALRKAVLHDIKNKAMAASNAHYFINRVLNPSARLVRENIEDDQVGEGKSWNH